MEWLSARRPCVRFWRSGDEETEERLEWADEFLAPPRVVRPDDGIAAIVFEGRADAKMWKDWMVMMTHDASKAIPTIEFVDFDSNFENPI